MDDRRDLHPAGAVDQGMPTATNTTTRRPLLKNHRIAWLAAILACLLILGAVGAACVSCAAGTSQPVNANPAARAVERLAEALLRGQETDSIAEYRTASGSAVTVALALPRRAYRGKGVAYIVTPDAAYRCGPATGAQGCEESPGVDGMSPTLAGAVSAPFGGDFVVPEAALAALARIAHAPGARFSQSRRGASDCVAVTATGVRTETACVDSAGVLTFYAGTGDAGQPVRLELLDVRATVAPDAFTPAVDRADS